LAGFANEGFAGKVFIGAWGFAYEHDLGVDVSHSEDCLSSGAGKVRALEARGNGGAEFFDAVSFRCASGGEDFEGWREGSGF
jgi:hypothetical protein